MQPRPCWLSPAPVGPVAASFVFGSFFLFLGWLSWFLRRLFFILFFFFFFFGFGFSFLFCKACSLTLSWYFFFPLAPPILCLWRGRGRRCWLHRGASCQACAGLDGY